MKKSLVEEIDQGTSMSNISYFNALKHVYNCSMQWAGDMLWYDSQTIKVLWNCRTEVGTLHRGDDPLKSNLR